MKFVIPECFYRGSMRERRWAKEQIIIDESDGSIVILMKTSGWMDVKKWILSFGARAKLLEPAFRRTEIAAEFAAGFKFYL